MNFLLSGLLLSTSLFAKAWAGDSKIYGVNLGSWLVIEPWMLPQEWLDMGGQLCPADLTVPCSACIASEMAFVQAYPDTADAKFAQHWDTWFTQDDVNTLKAAGINTIRVPLGYWIVEALVNRTQETYPRGGLGYLRRGLGWLQDAGMQVILDHHALPGVQSPNQMFTGYCTTDVQFYTSYNYHRALVWTAVMTTLSHLDPNFGGVFAIEAVNEPIMDANQTPGYGTFQKNFVSTMRAVELALGISVPSLSFNVSASVSNNFTASLSLASLSSTFSSEVQSALADAVPILAEIGAQYDLQNVLEESPFQNESRTLLTSNFMHMNWQYNNPANPADAADGPQSYDNHVYYSVRLAAADASPETYLANMCNFHGVQDDAEVGNSPLLIGEWALSTQFNATSDFLPKWADAQKFAFSQGAGWLFWNFKIEISNLTNGTDLARQWSYLEGLQLGIFTQDPSKLNDPDVCTPYINTTTSNTTSASSGDALTNDSPGGGYVVLDSHMMAFIMSCTVTSMYLLS